MAAKKTAKKVVKKAAKKAVKPDAKISEKPAAKKATRKAPAKKVARKAKKAAATNPAPAALPSHDAIARAAYLNYRRRVEQGLPGDTRGDWLEAERQLGIGGRSV